MNYYVDVLKKYTVFEGRAPRKEYWMFVLLNGIILIILTIIGRLLGFSLITLLYELAVLLPSLAVLARRLHDTDRTAWWILIALIPFVGAFVLVIFAVLDSQPGQNKYGPNPKGESVAGKGKNPFIIIAVCILALVLIMVAISVVGYTSIVKNSQGSNAAYPSVNTSPTGSQ